MSMDDTGDLSDGKDESLAGEFGRIVDILTRTARAIPDRPPKPAIPHESEPHGSEGGTV